MYIYIYFKEKKYIYIIYILKICLIFLTKDHNEKRILSFKNFRVDPNDV